MLCQSDPILVQIYHPWDNNTETIQCDVKCDVTDGKLDGDVDKQLTFGLEWSSFFSSQAYRKSDQLRQ